MQRIKAKLSQEVDCIETETKSMVHFREELELLIQEKKAHMEELRQIQNDIAIVIIFLYFSQRKVLHQNIYISNWKDANRNFFVSFTFFCYIWVVVFTTLPSSTI